MSAEAYSANPDDGRKSRTGKRGRHDAESLRRWRRGGGRLRRGSAHGENDRSRFGKTCAGGLVDNLLANRRSEPHLDRRAEAPFRLRDDDVGINAHPRCSQLDDAVANSLFAGAALRRGPAKGDLGGIGGGAIRHTDRATGGEEGGKCTKNGGKSHRGRVAAGAMPSEEPGTEDRVGDRPSSSSHPLTLGAPVDREHVRRAGKSPRLELPRELRDDVPSSGRRRRPDRLRKRGLYGIERRKSGSQNLRSLRVVSRRFRGCRSGNDRRRLARTSRPHSDPLLRPHRTRGTTRFAAP